MSQLLLQKRIWEHYWDLLWSRPSSVSLCRGAIRSLLTSNASRYFEAASSEVWCQTGRNRPTTKVSPAAPPSPHLHLAQCSARTDCRGRIYPMCLLWGRSGHRYPAPQEPECSVQKMVDSRDDELVTMYVWKVTLNVLHLLIRTFSKTKSTRPALFMLLGR